MSNRKFRPQAQQRPEQQPQTEEEMKEWIEKLSSLVGDKLVQAGIQAEALLSRCFEPDAEETLSDDYVRRTLKTCVAMATQIVEITSAVLSTIEVSTVRKIAAGEFKLPHMMRESLKAAGIDPTLFEGEASEPTEKPEGSSNASPRQASGQAGRTDPRKRPRGAKHPIVVLMGQGLQAVRLVDRITRATNPEVYNLPAKAA